MTIEHHLPAGLTLVAIDGISIAVEVVHNGEPGGQAIAWLHGLGSSSIQAFAPLARHQMLTGTTSLLIDLPGHGLSARAEEWSHTIEGHAGVAQRVVESIGIPAVTLVGHSMGGTVAIVRAASAPEGVERLIVAEPSLDPGRGSLSAHIAAQAEERFVGRGYAALVRVTAQQSARGDVGARAFLPSLRMACPRALHRTAVSLLETRSPSIGDMLAELTIPSALITGDWSPPPKLPVDVHDLKGYVVPRAGHMMMADNPGGFARAVAAAMGRNDRG